MQPDLLYVNGFIVACDHDDHFFEQIAAKAAGTESIAIHFDLANPSDAIPTDPTWHGWPIRYFRITKPECPPRQRLSPCRPYGSKSSN
jgi:hypothetical protein